MICLRLQGLTVTITPDDVGINNLHQSKRSRSPLFRVRLQQYSAHNINASLRNNCSTTVSFTVIGHYWQARWNSSFIWKRWLSALHTTHHHPSTHHLPHFLSYLQDHCVLRSEQGLWGNFLNRALSPESEM